VESKAALAPSNLRDPPIFLAQLATQPVQSQRWQPQELLFARNRDATAILFSRLIGGP
jgi:hypothetical protein